MEFALLWIEIDMFEYNRHFRFRVKAPTVRLSSNHNITTSPAVVSAHLFHLSQLITCISSIPQAQKNKIKVNKKHDDDDHTIMSHFGPFALLHGGYVSHRSFMQSFMHHHA